MTKAKKRLTGQEALAQAYERVDHQPLLDRLGVALSDDILCLALTHRSFANENGTLPNNERLEFLGDAVLGLTVAAQLYEQYPDRPESDISKMRASVVSRYGCADVAREINLGAFMLLGKGELATGGRDKESILADATEAVLGAIYREHGFEVTRKVILKLFANQIRQATAKNHTFDAKTALQDSLARIKAPMPIYESTSEGPDHDLVFSTQLFIDGHVFGTGTGRNKKHAEQEAAAQALTQLETKADLVAGRA